MHCSLCTLLSNTGNCKNFSSISAMRIHSAIHYGQIKYTDELADESRIFERCFPETGGTKEVEDSICLSPFTAVSVANEKMLPDQTLDNADQLEEFVQEAPVLSPFFVTDAGNRSDERDFNDDSRSDEFSPELFCTTPNLFAQNSSNEIDFVPSAITYGNDLEKSPPIDLTTTCSISSPQPCKIADVATQFFNDAATHAGSIDFPSIIIECQRGETRIFRGDTNSCIGRLVGFRHDYGIGLLLLKE